MNTKPRPKGSKNKATLTLDEQVAQVTAEIAPLQDQVKEKKAELRGLNEAKADEDKQRLIAAVLASDKSVDDIVAMIGGAE